MFAPDQKKVAHELLRVCRPGGTIGLTAWTPDGFVGEWIRLTAGYVPPPPGIRPPTFWGTEEGLIELFGDELALPQTTRTSFLFPLPLRGAVAGLLPDLFRPNPASIRDARPRGDRSVWPKTL